MTRFPDVGAVVHLHLQVQRPVFHVLRNQNHTPRFRVRVEDMRILFLLLHTVLLDRGSLDQVKS